VRLTLDSNVLVRAVISPRGPALRLLGIVLGEHILVLSRFILDEVERVLLYPRIRARYRITPEEAARFVGSLAHVSHLVEPVIKQPLVLDDPNDDPVLYTAADGEAEILCTRNTRHFTTPQVQEFCAARGIRVLTELEALVELRADKGGPATPQSTF